MYEEHPTSPRKQARPVDEDLVSDSNLETTGRYLCSLANTLSVYDRLSWAPRHALGAFS
jgi:hypothetical protein